MQAVKQERQDEAEIRELAAKFREANKAKMSNPARAQQGQAMSLISIFQSKRATAKPAVTADTKNVDEESVKGRFGWTCMGKVHIPYITRSGEHYCAVRMVELKVLSKLLNFLHQDLYNCTAIRSYYITEAEARLLNEINVKHCDYQFGREQFTTRDLIVRLSDANEFHQFLGHCYNKLVNTPEADSLDRCGFIRINHESVVPYTLYKDQKYVPLFYFEGETDNLKQRADKLEGWDLSYLKFCCKVQGIRNELFAHDSCSVISLNDIKNYFPPGTSFEDYWPKKNLDSQLLVTGNSRSQPPMAQWTRLPSAPPLQSHPPPSPKPATQAKAANNNQMHIHAYSSYGIGGGQPPYHAPQPRTASSAVRASYPAAAAAAASRHLRPSTSYYSISQAPPPLVRATQTYAPYGKDDWPGSYTNSQNNAANYLIMEPNLTQNNYHQASTLPKYPPPLLHMNGVITREMNNFRAAAMMSAPNPQPAHQSTRAQSAAAELADSRTSMTNGHPPAGTHIPCKLQKAVIDGKMVPCITMNNSVNSELLVTLPDLISNFFNNVPLQSCQQVFQVLGIELYKATSSQMRVLMENGKCQSAGETILLVQVRNVIDYMPQLKYMLNGMLSHHDIASKRQRTS